MIEPRFAWRLPEPLADVPPLVGVSRAAATLITRRGVTQQPALDALLADPTASLHSLDGMADAARALDRLEGAVSAGERVAIWGDYDADGITAIAIWVVALRAIGLDPVWHVPSRQRAGYGLSEEGLSALRSSGVSLVVTCDCGVTNVGEIAHATRIGLDVIVTDHHLPGDRLPAAIAVVDPHRADCHYPEKSLTGAGVAFKLAGALLASRAVSVADLAAYAAIGTIADVAPLTGENRAIVRLGLAALATTERHGLRALTGRSAAAPDRPSARDLAFGMAPRLNAAGRIADAELAIELLLETDRDAAERLANRLDALNRERQALTRLAVAEALATSSQDDGFSPLVLRNDTWSAGIIGLVAGRLADSLHRPVAVVTAVGEELRGSVRAPDDFHVARALAACATHLSKRGGHPAAGGFSMHAARFDAFAAEFRALPRPFPPDAARADEPATGIDVDLVLPARLLTWALIAELELIGPFGAGWPEPVVAVTGLGVGDVRRAGAGEGHVVLRMLRGRESIDAVAFDTPPDRPLPAPGMALDVVGTLEADSWLGQPRLRIRVVDYAEHAASPLADRIAAARAMRAA